MKRIKDTFVPPERVFCIFIQGSKLLFVRCRLQRITICYGCKYYFLLYPETESVQTINKKTWILNPNFSLFRFIFWYSLVPRVFYLPTPKGARVGRWKTANDVGFGSNYWRGDSYLSVLIEWTIEWIMNGFGSTYWMDDFYLWIALSKLWREGSGQ